MLEKPKKMRRLCPAGSAAHPAGSGDELAPATDVVRMPPAWVKPLSPTTTWLAVSWRWPLWLNCTLARSTCGQVSPDPMVRGWLRNVALPPDDELTRPF